MSTSRVAMLMPEVPVLLDRCRALGAIDAICEPDWHGYTFSPSAAGGDLTMKDESRTIGVHIGAGGALVWGWDIDINMDEEEPWQILSAVPDIFRRELEAATRLDEDFLLLSTVMWRLPGDTAWRPGPENGEKDQSKLSLFADLTDPSPGTILWSGALGVERASFRLARAIRQVLALRPLTEEIVRTLNPDRVLADVADPVAATGYRPARPDAAPPLDRGRGEHAPLVTNWESHRLEPGTSAHFLLDPDGDGFHRILVHHSGKALEVKDAVVGAAVVQAEPHDGGSQRFLVQEHKDGVFRDLHQAPGFDPEDVEAGEVDDLDYRKLRIIAQGTGLALCAGPKPGDPVVLAEPSAGGQQTFTWNSKFGYGLYGHLIIPQGGDTGPCLALQIVSCTGSLHDAPPGETSPARQET